ncbi:hypothetical protein [Aureivirga sp. CE67]|uniref:hypothetical protein n=1 Tax=Aureivirga sp. CE67 TaxID=1788983 RepID=UPI0018CA5D4F|nr:hypothetical protein [Aureivirga sp. CE67]
MKKCLNCEETFVGRIDKKYCSDYCRNSYNNRLDIEGKKIIRNINNRLRKNYKILSELNVSGKTKVSKHKLISKGFDFDYLTSIYTTKKGTVYHFCYDQGYLALENDLFVLIKRE